MPVIDVHTHMLTLDYLELLRANGTGKYSLKKTKAGQDAVHLYDAPFMTLFPGMWDYELRIKRMDEAKVDLAIVSLTCPNAYWGGREVALKAAQIVNNREIRPFELYLFIAVVYWLCSYGMSRYANRLERRLAPGAN